MIDLFLCFILFCQVKFFQPSLFDVLNGCFFDGIRLFFTFFECPNGRSQVKVCIWTVNLLNKLIFQGISGQKCHLEKLTNLRRPNKDKPPSQDGTCATCCNSRISYFLPPLFYTPFTSPLLKHYNNKEFRFLT